MSNRSITDIIIVQILDAINDYGEDTGSRVTQSELVYMRLFLSSAQSKEYPTA
ncbi:MAG: hypothetical protein ACJ707_11020 [Nitrososphaera sp.]